MKNVHGKIQPFAKKINGQSFKDDLKTGQKERYDLMYSIDTHDKDNVLMPDDESSGGVILMSITSYKE